MGKFIKHVPCPQCGSQDNASLYDDGGIYCHKCSVFIKDKQEFQAEIGKSQYKAGYQLPHLIPAPLELRRLDESVLSKYRVGMDEAETKVVFPYFVDGRCVGAKCRRIDRWEEKHYYWEGDGSVGLFGMQTASTRNRKLVIVEGEFDAIAAHQMCGLDYNVVSIAHGAKAAAKDIAQHVKWVNSHTHVYLCFDMDEVGREGTTEAIPLLKPGKAHVVLLPDGYKDANDMLKAGKHREFIKALETAQQVLPNDYVKDKGEIVEMIRRSIKNDAAGCQYPTPFAGLNKAIGGLNPGELITLCAHTGVGKTTLGIALMLQAMEQGRRVFLITLETNPEDVLKKMLEVRTGIPFYSSPNSLDVDESVYIDDLYFIAEHVSVYTGLGSMSMEKLESLIEYGAMAGTHEVVFLDHITAATQTTGNNQVQAIDNTMAMLNRLTTTYRLSTVIISHLSRDGDDKKRQNITLNSLRFSEGIAQYSHSVIGLVRDLEEEDGLVTVRFLKAHRRFGRGKPFQLKYNTRTFRYEEYGSQEESIGQGTRFAERLVEIQQRKNAGQVGQDNISLAVREADTRGASELDTVQQEIDVHQDIHAGLHDNQSDGQGDIHRSEGLFPTGGQNQDASRPAFQSLPTLAFLVQQRLERDKRDKDKPMSHIWRVGNSA